MVLFLVMGKYSVDLLYKITTDFFQGVLGSDEARTYPTIKELSAKHNVPAVTLYRKSTAQNWEKQRLSFQENLQIKIDDNRQKKMAKDAIDFDQNNMRIAKALQNEIVALLTLSGKKRKENEDKPYFSASSLNSLGMALSTCQRVGRLALGESTENTNISTEATVNEAFQLIEEILGKGNSKSNSQLH